MTKTSTLSSVKVHLLKSRILETQVSYVTLSFLV
jgi:hypothetical protein